MAPPPTGVRRRSVRRRAAAVVATIIVALAPPAVANVIGIDFGTESMKVALVQPGAPLEIVTNHFSKRKTETAVAFVRGERYFGSDAYGHLSRKPDCAYARLSTLLGAPRSDAGAELKKSSYMPMEITFNETRGALGVTVDGKELSVEELVAMVLAYAKDMTRAYGGNVVRDCVVTVPQFATQPEREAMIRAADLADLRVLSLIDENTAAAVQFGLDRIYEEKRLVLFYNLGSEHAQASLVEYSTFVESTGKSKSSSNKTVGQLEVLGKGWAKGAGSFALDLALTELLCDEFEKQHAGKYALRSIARPMAKLRASAKKVKEVLSSNKEIPVNIPALHDDVDFQTTLTRAQLEKAGAPVFDRLTAPIADAVKMANASFDDIDAVEIIGGGVRVPKVQEVLRTYLAAKRSKEAPTLDLGLHLNGDEAVALGAAFHGANVSTSFRVRKVGLTDASPFSVGVSLDSAGAAGDESWHKAASLFKRGSRYGGKAKTIAFQHDADLTCELAYEGDDAPGGSFALYNISGVADFARDMKTNATNKPKVMLSFVLDSSGLTTLSKAEVSLQVPIPAAEQDNATLVASSTTRSSTTSTDEDEAASSPANETETAADATEAATTTAADENATSEALNATTLNETSSLNETKTANATKKAPTSKLHKRSLTVSLIRSGGRSWASVLADAAEAKQRLADLAEAEEIRQKLAAAKNDLEAAIYATRNALEDRADEFAPVSTDEQREAVRHESAELEDWLYDVDDATATVALFVEKRRSLQMGFEAIVERAEEYARRDAAVSKARSALAVARKNATEVWPETKPWLEVEDLEDMLAKVAKAEQWLDDVTAKQKELALHEPPAFYVADIAPKLKPVAQIAARLEHKPKPKPVESTKNDTNATTGANATDTASAEDGAASEEDGAASSGDGDDDDDDKASDDKEAWDEL